MTVLWIVAIAWFVALLLVWAVCAAGADDSEHTGPRG